MADFLAPLRDLRAQVRELPRKALAQGQWNLGSLSGWGPEYPGPPVVSERLLFRKVLGPPWWPLGGSLSFFRATGTTTSLERFFLLQTKNLDFRRKWDKDEYEKLAEKRLTEEREKKDGGCSLHEGLRGW